MNVNGASATDNLIDPSTGCTNLPNNSTKRRRFMEYRALPLLSMLVLAVALVIATADYLGLSWRNALPGKSVTTPCPFPCGSPQRFPLSPSPTSSDEIADWKVYKDIRERWQLQVKYPKNWVLERDLSPEVDLYDKSSYSLQSPDLSILPQGDSQISRLGSGTSIAILPYEGPYRDLNIGLTDFIKRNRDPKAVVHKTEIDGYSAVWVDTIYYHPWAAYNRDYTEMVTVYYVGKGEKMYTIVRAYPEGKKGEYEALFQKILSTFKFLD